MPELPDIVVYLDALAARVLQRPVERVRLGSPFVLRSVEPKIATIEGRTVVALRRLGKRIVLDFDNDLFLAIHLMIAGRLHWVSVGAPLQRRRSLAAFDFPHGTLLLTEAGTKRRAAIHLAQGVDALAALDRGGVEVLEVDLAAFEQFLCRENHTLKRALTDPRLVSGIGNAYSDEILHRARLSPLKLTSSMEREEIARLFEACRSVLVEWIDRLRGNAGQGFPEHVTAFREGMAVHGRAGKPCPTCGTPVQRIVYADNETNYCPTCQTAGRLLADRALSRLLRSDWPRTLEELEEQKVARREPRTAPLL